MTVSNALGFIGLCGILTIGCGSSNGGGDNKCDEACSVITSCWNETNASCMAQCEGDLAEASEFGEACVKAVDDLAACIGSLSCEQLDGWDDGLPEGSYPCMAQDVAIQQC